MFNLILLILYLFFFSLILFYILIFRFRFAFAKHQTENLDQQSLPPVSVIICAKNEEHNLKINLPGILQQNYPEFEVIVVDDNSTDDTFFVLKSLQQEYQNLNVIRLNENVNFFSGKKFPLSIGIRSAKYEHLVLTDADCWVNSDRWLTLMASGFAAGKDIVLGYGAYEKTSGLLNAFIRFETVYTAMQYFSFAYAGIPYMGVGRNLAYTKKLFHQTKGFSSHYSIPSGDDDLFINACATKHNTALIIHPDAFTFSTAQTKWKNWFKQKRRHLTTGKYYKTKHKMLLSIYPFALLGFYTTLVLNLIAQNNFFIVFSLLITKIIISLIIYKKITTILKEKHLFLFAPILEILIILTYGMIILLNSFSKQKKWK